MERIAITNGFGKWFDRERADKYSENRSWDGSNQISLATGSQWEHEAIYVTKGGVFVLNHWSNYQGSLETYKIVSKEEAAIWFAKQGFSDEEIPSVFHEKVALLEIK